jgi:hypothetical protein
MSGTKKQRDGEVNMIAEGTYRARGIGSPQLGATEKGQEYAAALFEVTLGPALGARVGFRGYMNNDENCTRTVLALRLAGWRGRHFRDWSGFGSREVEIVVRHETAQTTDAQGRLRKFARVAFVNRVPELQMPHAAALAPERADDMSKRFARILVDSGESVTPPPAMTTNGMAHDEDTGEVFDEQAASGI